MLTNANLMFKGTPTWSLLEHQMKTRKNLRNPQKRHIHAEDFSGTRRYGKFQKTKFKLLPILQDTLVGQS